MGDLDAEFPAVALTVRFNLKVHEERGFRRVLVILDVEAQSF